MKKVDFFKSQPFWGWRLSHFYDWIRQYIVFMKSERSLAVKPGASFYNPRPFRLIPGSVLRHG